MQRIIPVWPFSSASFLWRNDHRVFIISRISCSGSHTISQIGSLRFWLMFVAPCYYPLCCETIWIHELSEEITPAIASKTSRRRVPRSRFAVCYCTLAPPVTPKAFPTGKESESDTFEKRLVIRFRAHAECLIT